MVEGQIIQGLERYSIKKGLTLTWISTINDEIVFEAHPFVTELQYFEHDLKLGPEWVYLVSIATQPSPGTTW